MTRLIIGVIAWLTLICAGNTLAAGAYAPAQQMDKPDLQVMGCPRGAVWDPRNGGECWSCGSDAIRTLKPVTSAEACITSPLDTTASAELLERNKTRCTGDAEFDPITASCWECPGGGRLDRAQPASGKKACFKRSEVKERKATYQYTTKNLLTPCRKGTFANVGSRRCHACPSGWNHDIAKKVDVKGVCFKPATTTSFPATLQKSISLTCSTGFFDAVRGGSCWLCPPGYVRGPGTVDSNSACIKPTLPETREAKMLGQRKPDPRQIARGALTLGCANQAGNAFFDMKDGGSCWKCPGSHPKRSLFPVDDPRACMSTACGAEGGRPCLTWERIPSCNPGLAEDFAENICKQPENFACRSYFQTFNAMRKAVRAANDTAGQAQQAALDQVPGKDAFMKALELTMEQLKKPAQQAAEQIDLSAFTGEFRDFIDNNQEFMKRMVRAVALANEHAQQIEALVTDPDFICSGNVNGIAWYLGNMGFSEILDPPATYGISVGAAQFTPARPFSLLAGLAGHPTLYAANELIKPHHRMVVDVSVSFPFTYSPGIGGKLSLTGSVGVQFATNFKDSNAVYLTHGVSPGAGLQSNDKNIIDPSKYFGGVELALGYQYRGDSPDQCGSDNNYSWGIPVKLGNLLGIGFNTTCPYAWSGFTVPVHNFKYLEEIVTTSTPSGKVRVVTPSKHRWPRAKWQLSGGYEGAWTLFATEKDARAGIF